MDHIKDPEVKEFFAARDMDLKDADLFFRMLSSLGVENQEIEVSTFVAGCLKLRGVAANIDIQALHFDMRSLHLSLKDRLEKTEKMITMLYKHQNKGLSQLLPQSKRRSTRRSTIESHIENGAGMSQTVLTL